MNDGRSSTIRITAFARREPCSTSSSSRVRRTVTKAYSAATKNAFQSTMKMIEASSIAVSVFTRRAPVEAAEFTGREGGLLSPSSVRR